MIIDATKMNYFKDQDRSGDETKNKKDKAKKAQSDDVVGVIVDVSIKGNSRKRTR